MLSRLIFAIPRSVSSGFPQSHNRNLTLAKSKRRRMFGSNMVRAREL